MDKYIEQLSLLPNDFLHIVKSYTVDNGSPRVEPAHILRALLHKNMNLVDYIENTLDSDYYYLLDWADMRMSQTAKSAYPMRDISLTEESKSIVREALQISKSLGEKGIDAKTLLAAVVSPGVGFSADQLKTLPLSRNNILSNLAGNSQSAQVPFSETDGYKATSAGDNSNGYYVSLLSEDIVYDIIGLDDKVRNMIETL